MKPYSILHISDLHRSPADPITNAELISALVGDRDRYIREIPAISVPEAIIVSGDIIQGVRLGDPTFESELAQQYAAADEFLRELTSRFLNGDRSRLIMVPGNHDVDWNTAFSALAEVPADQMPSDISRELHSENSPYRWDWKQLKLYKIADRTKYEARLAAFWRFFGNFYSGVPGLLQVIPGADANLFGLFGNRIGVAAFNSCHGNDCFAYHGMVRPEVVARSHLALNDSGKVFDLRLAVWHHSVEGPPYKTDYMDIDIVRGMIGRGFRLGLYGHQHKAQVAPQQIWLPDRERMAAVSAGSLCAGSRELPEGTHRQYNVIEIAPDFRSVRVHVRQMAVANLFSKGHLIDFGDNSFADLDWEPPKNSVGGTIDINAARIRSVVLEAEGALQTGHPDMALSLLSPIDLPPASYERQLFIRAATETQSWDVLLNRVDPPTSIDELVVRTEAFLHISDTAGARNALNTHATPLGLPRPLVDELQARIKATEMFK